MSQFDELLAQLQQAETEQTTLAKALPAEDGKDDKQIQAAAAEGDTAANPEDDDESGDDESGEGGPGDGEKPMVKSVTAVVDGEEVEAIDATDLLKSLGARVDDQEQVLAKALASTLGTLKAQGDMIKSLQDRVAKLSGQGTGRKTVLTVIEKPPAGEQTMAKSQQDGMTPADFMAKANAAFAAGKITGKELTTIDVAMRSNQLGVLGQDLLAKALS